MAVVATLVDDFNDNSIDTGKWSASPVGVVEQRRRMTIQPASLNRSLASVATYDLTSSAAFVELAAVADGASAIGYLEIGPSFGSDSWAIRWNAATPSLEFVETVGGVESVTSVTYDTTSHRWLRVRHAGTTLFWETAVNGLDWTVQRSKIPNATIDKTLAGAVLAAYDAADAATIPVEFDNFNATPIRPTINVKARMSPRAY